MHNSIAIVGISAEIPSGKHSKANFDHAEFYNFLLQHGEAYSEFPADRFNFKAWHGHYIGQINAEQGSFLKDIDLFDNVEFGISSADAYAMAPVTRKIIEHSFLALLDSGIDYRTRKVGCYTSGNSIDLSNVANADEYNLTSFSASSPAMLANRVSAHLDLLGPSFPVDTACSSSLTATHIAVQAILNKECEAAVVAGCQINHRLIDWIGYSQGSILAPDGKSKPFDASANGFARAESCVAIVLKDLKTAIQDGDHVYATILGTAINSSGSGAAPGAPVAEAQRQVMIEAFRTAKGDPTEVNWIGQEFHREKELLLGSVKGNIGHAEIASFLVSLSKVLSILQHQVIPPNWSKYNIVVPQQPTALPQSSSKANLIAMTSSGIGGSNGHLVLEGPLVTKDNSYQQLENISDSPLLLMAGGQGPQHKNMGKQLFQQWPVFQQSVLEMDALYKQITGKSLINDFGLFGSQDAKLSLTQPWPIALILPSIAIFQIALFDLLISLGIVPDAIVGHSAGETAVFYASGAAPKAMAVELAIIRGQTFSDLESLGGSMAALSCTPDQAQAIISAVQKDYSEKVLEIACYNSPTAVALAGHEDALDCALKLAANLGIFGRRIDTPVAIHSSMMETCRDEMNQETHPILGEHIIQGEPIMPAAGFMEMALEFGATTLLDVTMHSILSLSSNSPIHLELDLKDSQWTLHSQSNIGQSGSVKQLHASGYISHEHPTVHPLLDIAAIRQRCHNYISSDFYKRLSYFSSYGPHMQRVTNMYYSSSECLLSLRGMDDILKKWAPARITYDIALVDSLGEPLVTLNGLTAEEHSLNAISPITVPLEIVQQRLPFNNSSSIISLNQIDPYKVAAQSMDNDNCVIMQIISQTLHDNSKSAGLHHLRILIDRPISSSSTINMKTHSGIIRTLPKEQLDDMQYFPSFLSIVITFESCSSKLEHLFMIAANTMNPEGRFLLVSRLKSSSISLHSISTIVFQDPLCTIYEAEIPFCSSQGPFSQEDTCVLFYNYGQEYKIQQEFSNFNVLQNLDIWLIGTHCWSGSALWGFARTLRQEYLCWTIHAVMLPSVMPKETWTVWLHSIPAYATKELDIMFNQDGIATVPRLLPLPDCRINDVTVLVAPDLHNSCNIGIKVLSYSTVGKATGFIASVTEPNSHAQWRGSHVAGIQLDPIKASIVVNVTSVTHIPAASLTISPTAILGSVIAITAVGINEFAKTKNSAISALVTHADAIIGQYICQLYAFFGINTVAMPTSARFVDFAANGYRKYDVVVSGYEDALHNTFLQSLLKPNSGHLFSWNGSSCSFVSTLLQNPYLTNEAISLVISTPGLDWITTGSDLDTTFTDHLPATMSLLVTASPKFDTNGVYILLGGIGSLGVHIALFMYKGLDDLTIRISAVNGTSVEDMQKFIDSISLPIKGCILLAAVLQDRSFHSLTTYDFEQVFAAKTGLYSVLEKLFFCLRNSWNPRTSKLFCYGENLSDLGRKSLLQWSFTSQEMIQWFSDAMYQFQQGQKFALYVPQLNWEVLDQNHRVSGLVQHLVPDYQTTNIATDDILEKMTEIETLAKYIAFLPRQSSTKRFSKSTIGIKQARDGKVLPEEQLQDPSLVISTGYAESKWVAEQIIYAARHSCKLNASVIRVGLLSGSINGHWDTNHWFPSLVESGHYVGCLPDGDELVSWLPTDMAAAAVIELRHSTAEVMNLVHPNPVKWRTIMTELSETLHLPLVPYAEWFGCIESVSREQAMLPVAKPTFGALRLLDMFGYGVKPHPGFESMGLLPKVVFAQSLKNAPTLEAAQNQQIGKTDIQNGLLNGKQFSFFLQYRFW
ncbi:hypothetical protein C8R42DRAFT_637954 [Lentinula raphanica]|nr:hypothetical protein C8R42DRAFT_637954 [Lentinula raphanica]